MFSLVTLIILSALRELPLSILHEVFVEQTLRIIVSKKTTDINEHLPPASVPVENLQVLMCTKFEKYNFNSILKST